MQLGTCHNFTGFFLNLSLYGDLQGKEERNRDSGDEGVYLSLLESQFVQAAISHALNSSFLIHMLSSSASFPGVHHAHYFANAFKDLLETPN